MTRIDLCACLCILDNPRSAAGRGGGGAVPVQSVHAKDGRKNAAQGGQGHQPGEGPAGHQTGKLYSRLWCPVNRNMSPIRHSLALCSGLLHQNGVMSGLMQILLLKVSAHITEQLGMAPGGEFREAFKEVGIDTLLRNHLSLTQVLDSGNETADGGFFFAV